MSPPALYPAKMVDWDRIRQAVASGHARAEAAAMRYVFSVEDQTHLVTRNGFIRAQYAGNGFLMIHRAALVKLFQAHPELKYRRIDIGTDPLSDSPHRFALFDTMIEAGTGRYLSEDFAFCRRRTDLGGEIWRASSLMSVRSPSPETSPPNSAERRPGRADAIQLTRSPRQKYMIFYVTLTRQVVAARARVLVPATVEERPSRH